MNLIPAKISNVHIANQLSQVDFVAFDVAMTMFSLSLDSNVVADADVILGVKATSVSLAKKSCQDLSLSNQLPVTISSIEKGEILSSVRLTFKSQTLQSVITTRSVERLKFSVGEEIVALIKASDLSIIKVN